MIAMAFTTTTSTSSNMYPSHHRRLQLDSDLSLRVSRADNNNNNSNSSNSNTGDNDGDDTSSSSSSIPTTTPSSSSSSSFSLASYQQERLRDTFQVLDGSRFHFQILFVDTDNTLGRLCEGVCQRIAEYNDALFVLFPASATMLLEARRRSSTSSYFDGREDGMPTAATIQRCESLGLCAQTSTDVGTTFTLELLAMYDLVIVMNDEQRSLILRALATSSSSSSIASSSFSSSSSSMLEDEQQYYGSKIRVLSDFLNSNNFNFRHGDDDDDDNDNTKEEESMSATTTTATTHGSSDDDGDSDSNYDTILQGMLDDDLYERAEPYTEYIQNNEVSIINSNIFNADIDIDKDDDYDDEDNDDDSTASLALLHSSQSMIEAAMIVAIAGMTKFCVTTMEIQMDRAYEQLLVENQFFRELGSTDVDTTTTTTTTPTPTTTPAVPTGTNTTHGRVWNTTIDDQIRRCSSHISGYFSRQQRQEKYNYYSNKRDRCRFK